MAVKGVVIFRGDKGRPKSHYAKGQIADVIDDAALATFCTSIAAHTECNVAKRSVVELNAVNDALPGGTPPVNVDRKAIIYFRDPTSLKVHSFTLPGIIDADVELQDEGERVTAAALSTIVGFINTVTGKSYTGLYGVVIQPR